MRIRDGRSIAVRNIIWDIDGTLFDTYPAIAHAFKRALNDLGQDASLDRITDLARESLGHCATTLASECQVDQDRLETAFGEHYDRTGPDEEPPFAGTREICEHICDIGGQNVIVTQRGRGHRELLAGAAWPGSSAIASRVPTDSRGSPIPARSMRSSTAAGCGVTRRWPSATGRSTSRRGARRVSSPASSGGTHRSTPTS
jgi:hypothetical protein